MKAIHVKKKKKKKLLLNTDISYQTISYQKILIEYNTKFSLVHIYKQLIAYLLVLRSSDKYV